jgi:hypothetical protein
MAVRENQAFGTFGRTSSQCTMQDVVELLDSIKYDGPTEAQIKFCKESDFKLKGEIFADELDDILKLDGQPSLQEHLDLFKAYGIRSSGGDALAACAYATLIGYFEDFFNEKIGYGDDEIDRLRIAKACIAAMRDPAYGKPTLIRDGYWMTFTWPKRKLKEWYRNRAEY